MTESAKFEKKRFDDDDDDTFQQRSPLSTMS